MMIIESAKPYETMSAIDASKFSVIIADNIYESDWKMNDDVIIILDTSK